MSSTIKDFGQLREQEMTGLKKQVAQERRELEEAHQKNKAQIKAIQEQEIVEINDSNTQRISEAHQRREKVLFELEKNLNETKNVTEKQLKDLKSQLTNKEVELQEDHSQRRLLLNANNEQHLQEANYRYNSQLKKINTEGENRLHHTKETLSIKHNDLKDEFQNKIQQTTNHYNAQLARQNQDFEQTTKLKELEYKNKETTLRETHENNIIKQTEVNQDLYQKRDDDFRLKFQEQDQFFEKKFAEQLSSHHSQLQNLDKRFDSISKNMKQDLMTKIDAVKSKKDDIFFEFTELNSRIKDQGDHYQVEVELPEYARKDLNLSTNNKEIILTFNRRYQDHAEKNGVKHRVNKIETLTSRIPTEHHLNPKKINSAYSDGVMTYKIQKA